MILWLLTSIFHFKQLNHLLLEDWTIY